MRAQLLLWRLSVCVFRHQSKTDEFLGVVSSTIDSYVETFKDAATTSTPKDGADETQFLLALCGVITSEWC